MIAKKLPRSIIIATAVFLITTITFITLLFVAAAEKERDLTGKFYPHVHVDGKDLSGKSRKEGSKLFASDQKALSKAVITVLYEKTPIATFSASTLDLHITSEEALDRAYLIGRSENRTTRLYQQFAALFNLERYDFYRQISYDTSVVDDFLSASKDTYNKEPVNARFAFEDGRVTSFEPEKKGYALEEDKFKADFDAIIKSWKTKPGSKTVSLTGKVKNPDITLAKANQFGIEELIGTGKSDFSHSIPGRIHNVTLAASKFNGVLIPPNKVFSFNETVGDISALTGYEQAYVIKNGKTVLGDGGGVCQVSTTLFRAALNTGLPIVERTAHAYRVGYYENDSQPGFDATVYAPSVDLKIKNDTGNYILIQTQIDQSNNLLFFNLYGKKDGRTAEISPVTITNVEPAPPPVNQDDPTLKRGVTKQVDFAAPGAKTYFSYKVSKGGQVLAEKTFYSNYRPWQAVFLVGTQD